MSNPTKERNLKQIGSKWYLDFRFKNRRIREFGGFTKDQARNALAKRRVQLLDEWRGVKKPERLDPVGFEKFSEDFIELYAKQNKKSWRRDEVSLGSLRPFFRGETLQSITPEKIERYKASRKADVAPATVNLELACLKTLFTKAVEWGRIEASPAAKVKKFKLNNARERILSPEEALALVDAAPETVRPVVLIALKTGMRRGEILALRWDALNFIKSYILIENSKSGKPRKVPMSPGAREVFKAIPRNSDFVFYNAETRTHVKSVTTAFETARAKAELAGLRFHDLRHTFATWYLEAGGDIAALSKILGHASIQMTLRYCNPTEDGMLRAITRMDGILSGQKADSPSHAVPAPETVSQLETEN